MSMTTSLISYHVESSFAEWCVFHLELPIILQASEAHPQLKKKDLTFGYKIIYKKMVSFLDGMVRHSFG